VVRDDSEKARNLDNECDGIAMNSEVRPGCSAWLDFDSEAQAVEHERPSHLSEQVIELTNRSNLCKSQELLLRTFVLRETPELSHQRFG
jgi:hypothetical protein